MPHTVGWATDGYAVYVSSHAGDTVEVEVQAVEKNRHNRFVTYETFAADAPLSEVKEFLGAVSPALARGKEIGMAIHKLGYGGTDFEVI